MQHTPEDVNEAINSLDSWTTDLIVHTYKCALSKQLNSEKKLYKPLIKAIEKELRKRYKPIKDNNAEDSEVHDSPSLEPTEGS